MAYLEILSGYNTGQRVELIEELRLGRHSDNDIRLLDPSVSRYHARVIRYEDRFVVEDLGSSNGVRLCGEPISAHKLHEMKAGDTIDIGATQLVLRTEVGPGQVGTESGQFAIRLSDLSAPVQQSQAHYTRPLALCQVDDSVPPMVVAKLDASLPLGEVNATPGHSTKAMQEVSRRLRAICQIGAALGTINDLDVLLQKIVTCICDIFPGNDRVLILLQAPKSDVLVPVALKVRQETPSGQEDISLSRTLVDEVLTHKRAVLSQDTGADSRFMAQESIIALSIRSVMCAPLLAEDDVLGMIQVDAHGGPQDFTEDDLQLLNVISAQVATAVKQAQLIKQLAETNTALRRENARRQKAETASWKAQELAAKAQSANVAKSEFLANMSHELRTPLHVILNCANMGLSRLDSVPLDKLQVFLEHIAQNGETLLNLVNNLLDLAKLESGVVGCDFQPTALGELLRQMVSECHTLSAERQLTLDLDVPEHPIEVLIDADKIRQVVRNLLSNAIKFSAEGSAIRLRLHAEADSVTVTVKDQGPGIPTEELKSIFDKFVQSSLTKTGAGGTGLGLAICHEIIIAHQGRIWAENAAEGGAIFAFNLPLNPNRSSQEVAREA